MAEGVLLMSRRYVRRCLNSTCRHVFVTARAGDATRCPHCSNAPVGSVRRGSETNWPLKEAQKIARMIRGDKTNDNTVEDFVATEAA